jgi:hypothetical protein
VWKIRAVATAGAAAASVLEKFQASEYEKPRFRIHVPFFVLGTGLIMGFLMGGRFIL